MATQIMATPAVTGQVAKKVVEQLKKKPTEKTKRNAKNLIKMFEEYRNK